MALLALMGNIEVDIMMSLHKTKMDYTLKFLAISSKKSFLCVALKFKLKTGSRTMSLTKSNKRL